MKNLKLSPYFKQRLERLDKEVDDLKFLGNDLKSYDGQKLVAIVGTRKPTQYGINETEKLAESLSRAGVVIVSGLALGVDVIAHESSLEAGGKTIAVLPGGLSKPYPATNRAVAKQIVNSGGTLISEYSDNYIPRREDFLHRNRIVAALSDAIIITEAAEKSGSLNTAMHAKNMNIPVFCIPGNTTSPLSKGTNQLIKEGAYLITDADDVLRALGVDKQSARQTRLALIGETEQETLILESLSDGLTNMEDIRAKTGIDIADLQETVTMLEIRGLVRITTSGECILI